MKTTRRIAFALATLAAVSGLTSGTAAQTYPNKPIRLIVPSTPGSPTDVMARLVAQSVSNSIGQPVLVEPRPGGGGIIGTKAVVNAEPDGYTLLFTEGAKHLMTPALYDNVGFDPVIDVTPVATAGGGSFLLVVAPSVPATTVKELVEYARPSRQDQLRLRPGHAAAHARRNPQAHRQSRHLEHPLQGRRAGGRRHAGRSHPDELRHHRDAAGADQAGQIAAARRHQRSPPCRTARHADHGGKRLPQPDAALLDGGVGAAAHAGRDRREAQRRDRRGLKSQELAAGMTRAGFEPMPMDARTVATFMASESPKWLAVAKTSGVKGD